MPAAHTIARAYDDAMAAYWRGELTHPQPVAEWLATYWRADAPPEPPTTPAAVSLLGAGGHGVRWYQTATTILGYAGDQPHGGYVIPVRAVRSVAAATAATAA